MLLPLVIVRIMKNVATPRDGAYIHESETLTPHDNTYIYIYVEKKNPTTTTTFSPLQFLSPLFLCYD